MSITFTFTIYGSPANVTEVYIVTVEAWSAIECRNIASTLIDAHFPHSPFNVEETENTGE